LRTNDCRSDVNNADVSKRYTHDTIRPLSFYGGEKSRSWFHWFLYGSQGDMKILQMLKNIDEQQGRSEFKAPLVVAPLQYCR
jgi:aconitate hydratase 2/2-methylisocitrate dehydratase